MQPQTTDIDPLPHRWRNLLPLTGLTSGQVRTVCALARQQLPPTAGRPWLLPLPVRVLLVLIHLRTNLTTRALAALFHTSQSTVDRIIHHLVPVLAGVLRPSPDNHSAHPWIIDGTLIPVHDQAITAISKNYRRSVNTQIIICAHQRRVVMAGQCWPGNRNDVIVARATVAHLLAGKHEITHPRSRRACHRQDQGLANPSTVPPPRRRHQPQPPDRCRSLEPQNPQAITGQLLASVAALLAILRLSRIFCFGVALRAGVPF